MKLSLLVRIALFIALAVGSSSAFAQATRTWVSGVGDDANPCSRTAPCKTFAGAISKTAAGGEINCIDSGGFGAVTITKSITIDGLGTMASILNSGTNGVIVNAAATDVVILRNLEINGAGTGVATDHATGLSGVRFLAGKALIVDNVNIYGQQKGIDMSPSNSAELYVNNSNISRNFRSGVVNAGGIVITPGAAVFVFGVLNNVHVEFNDIGLRVEARGHIVAKGSSFSGNNFSGVSAFSTTNLAQVMLDECNVSDNGSSASDGGIKADGPQGVVRVGRSVLTDNAAGFLAVNSGQIISFVSNVLEGNSPNGAPTSTAVLH